VSAEASRPQAESPQRPTSELIIGRHPILEALRAGRRLNRLMVAEGAHGAAPSEILRLAAERSVTVQRVPRERLDALSDHHQGVVADAAPYVYAEFSDVLDALERADREYPPLVLAVDALQDPQNFGNLLRTALAIGVEAVILPERRSVGVTPAVGRASAGAIEHLRIARVVNLTQTLNDLKQAGLWVVGLDAEAPESYLNVDLAGPLVVVVGSEGAGLGRLVAETCDTTVRLPMVGPLDSLNAAVAGSVVLYEALRQRRLAAPA
jgi:23S rRNA (guanosine2251-2'-O)-methyltransferase